jgi:hypothetical protein
MIKIEFKDKMFVLSNDDKEVFKTKNWKRIMREARDIMKAWETQLIKKRLI